MTPLWCRRPTGPRATGNPTAQCSVAKWKAADLMPLYERLKANLLASAKLAVDETPVPVLDPGRGQTKTGYFWAIARDDRPWGGTDPPAVVYTYAPGRGKTSVRWAKNM